MSNRTPGPIDAREVVHVGVGPNGDVRSVVVDQDLTVHGVGDFTLKFPGPARDVTGPPDATVQPGLRRGSVIWEGFSAGTKPLDATVTLDPALETLRLPLQLSITTAAGGVGLRVTNVSASTEPFVAATPDRAALATLLDQLRAAVVAGQLPVAGAGGFPLTLPATGSAVRTDSRRVITPFRVRGTVTAGAASAAVDALVPGPNAPDGVLVVHVQGSADASPTPRVSLTAHASAPDPSSLTPPASAPTWRDALAHASPQEVASAFHAAQAVLWQDVLATNSPYLGNPQPGSSDTTFLLATVRAGSRARAPRNDHLDAGALALVLVAAAGVVATGTVVWARS